MEGHCVGQLTDASVVLRFGYQAIRRAGLPTEEILTKAALIAASYKLPIKTQMYINLNSIFFVHFHVINRTDKFI